LKKEDTTYAGISWGLQIIYWVLIPLNALIAVWEYIDSRNVNDIFSGLCIILAFIMFALLIRKYYKEYNSVDYSLPTVQMLKKAAYRYHPFRKSVIWALLAVLLLDAGLTPKRLDNGFSVVSTQIMFGGAIIFGLLIGLIIWYIKYKPIRDEDQQQIKDIEGE